MAVPGHAGHGSGFLCSLVIDAEKTTMSDRSHISPWRILLGCCAALALPMTETVEAAQADQTSAVLQEVVVTAQKRRQNIQDVPAAVSSISPQLLDSLHATQLADIGSYVPGLQINSGGTPGQTTISIRGIAPIGPGATVATYIDDTPIGSSSAYGGGIAFALDLLPYDVARVEVLRGPQGTLYGASSMGGLVKYVLTTPSLDTFHERIGGDLQGVSGAGSVAGGARATFSGPIVDQSLGFTASYAREVTPGFIDNAVYDLKGQNRVVQQSGRFGLLWQPSAAFSGTLNVLYQGINAAGDANVALDPSALQPLYGRLDDDNLTPQPFRKQILYYSLALDYRMSWAHLVSATSYTNTATSQTQDASYTYGVAFPFFGVPAGESQYAYLLHLRKYTQELRLESIRGAKLEWLGGFFATYEDSHNCQSPSALTLAGVPIPGLNPLFAANLPSTYTEYAGFGDLTYHFTDAFSVLGGVRYSHNQQKFSEIGGGAILPPVSLLDQRSSEGVATYSVGAKYRFTPRVMAYIRVATGYQPGGPNLSLPGVPSTFKSDTLTNYEVGFKSQALDNRLLFDADAFDIEWRDIQLLTSPAGISYGANGGTARSRGFETNAAILPSTGWRIEATLSYVDAILTEDSPAISGLNGDRLPNIPKLSGSLRVSYDREFLDGWSAGAGAGLRAEDRRYSDVNNAVDSRPLPGFTAIDLDVSVSHRAYTVRIFARNVTDKRAYLTYNPLFNQATGSITQLEAAVVQPRTLGIALDAKF